MNPSKGLQLVEKIVINGGLGKIGIRVAAAHRDNGPTTMPNERRDTDIPTELVPECVLGTTMGLSTDPHICGLLFQKLKREIDNAL